MKWSGQDGVNEVVYYVCHRDLNQVNLLGPLIVMKAIAFLSSLRTLTAFVNSESSNSSNPCNSSKHFWYIVCSFIAFLCKHLKLAAENISYKTFSNLSPTLSHALLLRLEVTGPVDLRFLGCTSFIWNIESESRAPSTTCVGRLLGSEDRTVSVLLFSSSGSKRTPLGNWYLPLGLSPIDNTTHDTNFIVFKHITQIKQWVPSKIMDICLYRGKLLRRKGLASLRTYKCTR